MHLSMPSRRGGRRGIGREFDLFQKIAVKFLTPRQKCEVKYNFPTPGKWSQARTKIQISVSPGQQDNSNALTPGQSDGSKSRAMVQILHPTAIWICSW